MTDQAFQRDLLRGSLDLLVLAVVAEGPTYGYEIQKKLREATANAARVQAGTLYPLLHRLEAEGVIRAKWDKDTGRPRKWYELTAAGRRRLQRQTEQWRDYTRIIEAFLAPPPRRRPAAEG